MKKLLIVSALAVALTGCSTYYSYQGKVYQVTGQGEFGEVGEDGRFIPLNDDDLLRRAARDGNQYNSSGVAQDDADTYNSNIRLAELALQRNAKDDNADGENAGDEEEEDSKGD